jgi:hypothetical protein
MYLYGHWWIYNKGSGKPERAVTRPRGTHVISRFCNVDLSLAMALERRPTTCQCSEDHPSPDAVHWTSKTDMHPNLRDWESHSPRAEDEVSPPPDAAARCPSVIPVLLSYDSNCQLTPNLYTRFHQHFPHLLPRLDQMRFSIPMVHLRDHKEFCEYLYGTYYMWGGGHFYGEQAEAIWAEFNQVGARTRQMSPGHRHDTLNDQLGYWNWQKQSSFVRYSSM